MTAAIALVDLDDTLFQTIRKCPDDVTAGSLTAMAHDRGGMPLSFATPRQMALIEWLSATAIVVPVTGRSVDALSRVNLGFTHAVAAHGGVVLRPDGPCPDWHDRISSAARVHKPELERIAALLGEAARFRDVSVNVRIIAEGEAGLYVVAKHADPAAEGELHDLAASVADQVESNWTRHVNGNNVAFLPPFLGKHHAAAHLLAELRAVHPNLPVIGLGDSVTDAPFLALCDMIAFPSGSQLAQHALAGLA